MYDTDYNIELACLKVLEAGDAGEGDSWASVEKPKKKEAREERPLVSTKCFLKNLLIFFRKIIHGPLKKRFNHFSKQKYVADFYILQLQRYS